MSTVPVGLAAALADRYRLERELGAGGMATVYLAEDLKHHRQVAVKVLRPDLVAFLGAERFLREIEVTAHLQHPHILALFDSGQVHPEGSEGPGFLYYVMPYIEGVSLRQKVRQEGALPIPEAVRILRDVADAMAHAHAQGVVHRDIKPENVMLSGRHALVMDFGVAKALAVGQAAGSGTLTGTGLALGTPAYMAPEQVAGDSRMDHRADIYAWGVLAYELLTGRPPFVRENSQALMGAHVSATPEPISAQRAAIGPALAQIVMRCLEKAPGARYQSSEELLGALEGLATPSGGVPVHSPRSVLAKRLAVAAVVILIVGGAAYTWATMRRERQARAAIPLIQRLFEAGQTDSAYALATRTMAMLPGDSSLRDVWRKYTDLWLFCTEPAGARVSRAPFSDTTRWQPLGTTPTDTIRLPAAASRIRFEKPGYRPRELLAFTEPVGLGVTYTNWSPLDSTSGMLSNRWCGSTSVRLDAIADPDSGLVHIPAGPQGLDFTNLRPLGEWASAGTGTATLATITLRAFRIGRWEVTNREYREFVRAGGYTDRSYWEHPFLRQGKPLSWDEAMRLLVDRTGDAGPSTWEGGDLVPGSESLPVGGLSWYEAAAYAKFAGRSLPTIYHWVAASGINNGSLSYTETGSNMGSAGPRPPSTRDGMSFTGAFDMAGNVREWVTNLDPDGDRYILGGGWTDPTWAFTEAIALDPFDRSPMNGVRLADLPKDDPDLARAGGIIPRPANRDLSQERPVPDDVYRGFLQLYDYDPTPLNAVIVSRDSSPEDWVVEKVVFDAAYGGERIPAFLFLPKRHPGPYQTVVYYPGSYALTEPSSTAMGLFHVGFMVRSGRAVIWPVYKSTFERGDKVKSPWPNESVLHRDHVVMWVKDVRRTIDYLATRPDIDSSRLAYFGYSWGSILGPMMLALEQRLRVGVFFVGGIVPSRARPEVEVVNYLPRVKVPVLMVNGAGDPFFPPETTQQPMFLALGTKLEDKRHVVAEGGHFAPRALLIKETLAWLDRYLGPVR